MKPHKTSRRSFLKQFAVTVGTVMLPSIGAGAKERTAKRPNVVLIMTDDQGYGDFSCHGNPVLKTPNMDRLASQSVRLQDFHVAPVCTPTRGQLLTGIDAIRNGATSPTGQRHLLKRNLRTMGDVFAQNGYRTALYGKWHLGGNSHGHMPHERGFQDALYYLRGGVQSHPNTWNSDLFDDVLYHNGKQKEVPGYATDVWFDHGTKFAKQCHKHNEPFFLYLPLNAPHGPLLAPDKFREPYRHLDKPTATFFAMIATVDCRLGEFVKMLEDEGMRDNTILVFLTDNGTAHGEKIHNAGMRGKKGSLYEGGHRVPCWISWPKGHLRHAGDVNTLTQCQDLLPTLIDLCRLNKDPEHQMDGSSLAPLLRGKPQPKLNDRILVYQHNENMGNGLVLQGKWRLVKNELYNIADDPSQTTNVAQKHPDVVKRLKAHYEKWWKSVEPHLDLEPFRLGVTDDEDMLTAYDWWYGRRVYNWPHLRRGDRSNGRYLVCIERGGNYRISLRRWPRESGLGICDAVERYVPTDSYMAFDKKHAPFPPGKGFDVVEAKIRFGNQEKRIPVTPDSQEVVLNFYVPQGETTLQTWFIDKEGKEFGANYVYILRK